MYLDGLKCVVLDTRNRFIWRVIMKNLGEYLSPEYSWWIADYGDTMTALNPEINPTSENIRIILNNLNFDVFELFNIKY